MTFAKLFELYRGNRERAQGKMNWAVLGTDTNTLYVPLSINLGNPPTSLNQYVESRVHTYLKNYLEGWVEFGGVQDDYVTFGIDRESPPLVIHVSRIIWI